MAGSAILDPINAVKTTADSALAKATANEQNLANITATTFAVPTGGIIYWAGNDSVETPIPTGFLVCNGASYSTAAYSDLFAQIRYIYGGSGAVFNVPDLRSLFLMGYDDSDARAVATVQESANKSHSHAVNTITGENNVNHTHAATTVEAGNHQHTYSTYVTDASSSVVGNSGFWQNEQIADTGVAGNHTHTINVGVNSVNHTHALAFNTESQGDAEARPRNINMYALIKT